MDDSLNLNLTENSFQYNTENSYVNENNEFDDNFNASNISGIANNESNKLETLNNEESEPKHTNNTTGLNEVMNKYSNITLPSKDIQINNDNEGIKTSFYSINSCTIDSKQYSVIILKNATEHTNELTSLIDSMIQLKKKVNVDIINQMRNISYEENSGEVYIIFDKLISSNYISKSAEYKGNHLNNYFISFLLLEGINSLHKLNQSIYHINPSTMLFTDKDELSFIMPFDEYKVFFPNPDPELDENTMNYFSTEEAFGLCEKNELPKDIWKYGCLVMDLFAPGYKRSMLSEQDYKSQLKEYVLPQIPKNVPKDLWSFICICLNPYKDVRITASELLGQFIQLIHKTPELSQFELILNELKKCGNIGLDNNMGGSMYNNQYSAIGGGVPGENIQNDMINSSNNAYLYGDPLKYRKCALHNESDLDHYCAKCNEIICKDCETKFHSEHNEAVFSFEEYVKLVNERSQMFKTKFDKYVEDTQIANQKEKFGELLKTNQDEIELMYNAQQTKITEQFNYLHQLLDKIKEIELQHLFTYKKYFQDKVNILQSSYEGIQKEISDINQIIGRRFSNFTNFKNLPKNQQENIIKGTPNEDNLITFKKKEIIKLISHFLKEKEHVSLIKRYFDLFVFHYKDTKINDIVKLLEMKISTLTKKYNEENKDSNYNLLVKEFEDSALDSSRNYFNTTSRNLFLPLVNTQKIFAYNFELNKFLIITVDFSNLPIKRFPNYSRNLTINGNLIINGGFDEESRCTLPDFLLFTRENSNLTKLQDMIYGHSAHSLIYLPPTNELIVVSGSGIVKCELYSFETEKWNEIPEINTPRQNPTLFYYNKQYLYAFGGAFWDETQRAFVYLDSVERLNLGFGSIKGDDKWEVVNYFVKGSDDFNLKKSVMSVLSYKSNSILLVGGATGYNSYTDECVLFDFDTNSFELKPSIKLPHKTCFPNKAFLYYPGKAYQLDNDGNVYEFNFETEEFSIIKLNEVVENNTKY